MSHIWMSRVTHMNESGHTTHPSTHVTHMDASSDTQKWGHIVHMNESCHTFEWVILRVWMRHITHMNESRRTRDRVWMLPVTHKYKSYHTYECVTSHVWLRLWMRHVTHEVTHMSDDTHLNALCHTYECVTSYKWMFHIINMNEGRHTYE